MKQKERKKSWKSIKLLMSLVFISLFVLLLTNCKRTTTPGKDIQIALYSDQGADEECIKATMNMFKWMGYTVVLVKANLINNEGLGNFNILCVPGGNMY